MLQRPHRSALFHCLLLLTGAVAIRGSAHAADVIATWDGTSNPWSDASHWSSALFPDNGNGGLTYEAIVGSGVVSVDVPVTLDRLQLSSGTIAGTENLSVATLDWSGGRLSGTGTIDAGGGTWTGASGKFLDQTLQLTGDVAWDAGTLTWASNQGTIQATAGSTFTAMGANPLSIAINLQVDAGGTFAMANSSRVSFTGPLLNEGQVAVDAGELRLSAGVDASGDFAIAPAAAVHFNGGTHSYSGNFSGDGLARFASGTVSFEAPATYSVANTQVAGGTVNFNTANTVALGALPFTSGVLGGTSDLSITALDWTSGRFAGTGNVSVAGGNFTTAGAKFLDQTMQLTGDVTWEQGTITWAATRGTLQVSSGSTFTVGGASALSYTTNLQIDAGGTLAVTNPASVNMSGPMVNEGNVQVDAGELRLSVGSASGGDFSVAPNADMIINGGTHTYSGDFSGGGRVRFTSGTTTFDAPASYTVANTEVAGGTIQFNTTNTVNLGTLPLNGGAIGGASDLSIGFLDWASGRFVGTGTVDTGGGLFTGSGSKFIDQTMQLTGDVMWDNGTITWAANQGTLQVTAGSTFTAGGANALSFAASLQVDPGGTLAVANPTSVSMNGPLLNEGLVDVDSGELRLGTGVVAGGDFSIGPNTTMQIIGGTHTYTGTFSGDGLVGIVSGTTTFDAPATYTVANTEITGGTVHFNTGNTVDLGILPFSNATIGGTSDISIESLDWTSGRFIGTGVVRVEAGTFTGTGAKFLDQTMRLEGDAQWDSGNLTWASTQGTLQVTSGGTFRTTGSSPLAFAALLQVDPGGTFASQNTNLTSVTAPFVNDGAIEVQEGILRFTAGGSGGGSMEIAPDRTLQLQTGTFDFSSSLDVTDGATVELSTALLSANPIVIAEGGRIEGAGRLASPTHVLNSGSIRGATTNQQIELDANVRGTGTLANVRINARHEPGMSPAIVALEERYTLTPTSTLAIEIGGQTPGTEHDRIDSTGNIELAGTLEIEQIDLGGGVFQPQFGDAFVIARADGELTGTFGQVDIVGLDPVLTYDVFYDYATDVVTVSVSSFFDADFDLDGDVDGDDFLIWQLGFPTPSGGTHFTGDADSDGDVDGEDFLVWQGQFGASLGGEGGRTASGVPEPATASLLLATIGLLHPTAARRRNDPWGRIGRIGS